MTEQQWKRVTEYKTYQDFVDKEPSYEDSLEVSKDMVGFAGNGIEGEDALKLISLVSQLTVLYRTKNPEVQPVHILSKAYGKASTRGAYKQYRQISLMCELFITPDAKFSTYGYRSVAEMLEEIRRIMDEWLPF